MNSGKVYIIILAIFTILTIAHSQVPSVEAQAVAPIITQTQSIYAIWKVGGSVGFTVTRMTINSTYYVWYQRPNDSSTTYHGTTLTTRTGAASFQIALTPHDAAGTYVVSLSDSPNTDTRAAVAHFGILGIDRDSYNRTDTVQAAGGGFSPNSTLNILFFTASGTVAGNVSVKASPKGGFTYGFRLLPSLPTGSLRVSVSGSSFDAHSKVTLSSFATVSPALLTIVELTGPGGTVQRTSNATISFKINYPDGSPVIVSTLNSTRITLKDLSNTTATSELRLALIDPLSGVWATSWVPSYSQKLEAFQFIFSPSDFNDSYGNTGQGGQIISTVFHVTPVFANLTIPSNSSLQRTLTANIVFHPTYHDGSPFMNMTQAAGTVTTSGGRAVPILFTGTPNGFVAQYKTNASTPLGTLVVSANFRDLFGNTANGTVTFQVTPAVLVFTVNPTTAERTTLLNATARLTYPDGTLITSSNLPLGFNVTISKGNFTWTNPMLYDPITGDWSTGYRLSQNATLGAYAVAMNTTDAYGNAGRFSGTFTVIPAAFQFLLSQSSVKVNPNTLVYIVADVLYPNGTALTPDVAGAVAASLTNSSGTFTFPMVFNSTGATWVLPFTAPDPGLRFGLTLTFSFSASDQFGNAGSAADAFQLNVGAGAETLILATIVGALPPIGLISWAIATISTRRRKHKP